MRLSRRPARATQPDGASAPPSPGERIWVDAPDAIEQLSRRTRDRELRHHATEIIERGVTCLRGAVSPDVCDDVRADYARYCDGNADAAAHVDGFGLHARLANFHLASERATAIGTEPRVMELLDLLFGHRAAVYSSLTFERGTRQRVHRDTPYFFTDPPGFFFGVWTALEDVRPDAGPLVYFEGGHHLLVEPRDVAEVEPARRGEAYQTLVETRAVEAGLQPTSPTLRRGDVLVWHPDLPHGGAAVLDPAARRASIVFHCVPEGVPVDGIDVFLGGAPRPPRDEIRYFERNGRRLVDQVYAHFEPDA